MSTREVRSGAAYVELLLRDAAFTKGLKNAGRKLTDFGRGVASTGAIMSAAGAAIMAPLTGAIMHFANYGAQLKNMSERTGVGATALAELGYAAEQTGAHIEDVETGFKKMEKFLEAATYGAHENRLELARLGVSMEQLHHKSPEEAFDILAHKIAAVHDPVKKVATALAIFGRGGTALLPMIEEMDALRAKARELGLAPSEAAVKTADRVKRGMDTVKSAVGATAFEIGDALSGAVMSGIQQVTGIVTATTTWVKQNHDLVTTVAAVGGGLLAAGAAVTALGLGAVVVGTAMSGIASGIGLVAGIAGVVLSPIGLVTAALITGATYWARYTDAGKETVGSLLKIGGQMLGTVRKTMGGIFDAVAAGNLPLAGDIAMTGLRLVFAQGMTALSKAVGGTMGGMIGKLGTQLAAGDLAGAWGTAVAGMAALWDAFSKGVVDTFVGAANKVIGLWKSATSAISDFILKDAANGGILGTAALLGSGVDLQSEKGKADLIRRQSIATHTKRLDEAQGNLEESKANGGTFTDESGTYSTEQLQKYVDDIKGTLKELGSSGDFIGKVQADARDEITSTAGSIRTAMDAVKAQADANARESGDKLQAKVGGGVDQVDALTEELKQKLGQELGQSRDERKKKAEELDAQHEKHKEGTEALPSTVQGSFSAAALSAIGTRNPAIDLHKKSIAEQKKSNLELERMRRAVEQGMGIG